MQPWAELGIAVESSGGMLIGDEAVQPSSTCGTRQSTLGNFDTFYKAFIDWSWVQVSLLAVLSWTKLDLLLVPCVAGWRRRCGVGSGLGHN